MTEITGKTIGKYRILERLGRGGMAEVYKAYQPSLDRYVAIKVLHSFLVDEEGFLERFEREARAVANLRHPNIVRVYDFDHEGELYYMVMEYIDGLTLKAKLKELNERGERFSLEDTVRILIALANALDYAHQRGVVHRDVKPANVMFTKEGQVVMADFGIARIMGASRLTMTGAVSGTPVYMSPEQGMGQEVDYRTDLYALGIILYEMVTGRVPFDADTPFAIIRKHISEPLPLPRQIAPDVPEGVERVILKALSKNPDDRYQTGREMTEALQKALAGAPTAPPEVGPVTREGMAASAASAKRILTPPPGATVVDLPRAAARPNWLLPAIFGGGVVLIALLALGLGAALFAPKATPTPTRQSVAAVTPVGVEPTATPSPTATATPVPTATPYPTYTPYPTPTPMPATDTPTPLPTDTPVPLPTNTPRVVMVTATPLPPTPTPPPLPVPQTKLAGKIAYPVFNTISQRYDIWVANVDGSGARRIAEQMRQPQFNNCPGGCPKQGLIIAAGDGPLNDNLYWMNSDGSGKTQVSDHPEDSHPVWSPDGERWLFDSMFIGDGKWHLHVIEDLGTKNQPRTLKCGNGTQLEGRSPTWLQDWRVVYAWCDYCTGSGRCGLLSHSSGSDTSDPMQLTFDSTDKAPAAISVPGDLTVAFMSLRDGNWEIYTMNAVGPNAGLTRLTTNPANDGLPTWSPDGKHIAFVSDRGGGWAIWAMNRDGSNQQKLFDLPDNPWGTGDWDWTTERIAWGP